MRRRGFFQRLGALLAGAAIAPHVRVEDDDLPEGFLAAWRRGSAHLLAEIDEYETPVIHTSGYSHHAITDNSAETVTSVTWSPGTWIVSADMVPGHRSFTL